MEYIIKTTNTDHSFSDVIKGKNVPLLVLDQKWHRLFADVKKPDPILQLEKNLNGLLARQGKVQQEIKDLKKLKGTLLNNIVINMDGAEGSKTIQTKKLEADKRFIEEINEKLENFEDELLELPKLIKEANEVLMIEGMEYCYERLRTNSLAIEEIGEWIKNIRIELKKQVIRKQNAEIINREIYSYMHDILGAQMIDVFDLEYQEQPEGNENPEEKATK